MLLQPILTGLLCPTCGDIMRTHTSECLLVTLGREPTPQV